jgi:rhamnose transport system permease protein
MLFGVGLGLVLGMINGVVVAVLGVPSIVATLGTLSIYRGIDFLIAGGKQVTATQLPAGYTAIARATLLGIPVFVLIAIALALGFAAILRWTTFGRSVYAVGSNPEGAAVLGIRAGLVTFVVFSICGLLGGVAGVMWGILFGTINATSATGVTLQVVAAVVVGGVNIFGGSGTVIGAALGALFLTFIGNALILLRLSQFWLQALSGLVILIAVALDAVLVRQFQRSVSGRRAR